MTDLTDRLRADGCPDPNCDGKGTICLGAHDHGDGDIEYQLEQCRYCDERQEAADAIEAREIYISQVKDAEIGELKACIKTQDEVEWSLRQEIDRLNTALAQYDKEQNDG